MSITVFTLQQIGPNGLYIPTVKTNPALDAEKDANRLRSAMKGFGTNEKELIAVLTSCSRMQRMAIRDVYERLFGRSLLKDIQSETSGDFRKLLLMLVRDVMYFEAHGIYKAIKGLGTDERRINQILLGKSNKELLLLKEAYQLVLGDHKEDPDRTILGDLRGDTSGLYKFALELMVEGKREEPGEEEMRIAVERGANAVVQRNQAEEDAKKLLAAVERDTSVDDEFVVEFFCTRSYLHLAKVIEICEQSYNVDLYKCLYKNLAGDVCPLICDIYEFCVERDLYYARLLKSTTAGLGTKDDELMRLLVTRCDIDLGNIAAAYMEEYKCPLTKDIADDTSGDYKKTLLALCGGP